MLIMTKTTEADAGCYKVVATNDAGSAESLGWMAVFGMREGKRTSYFSYMQKYLHETNRPTISHIKLHFWMAKKLVIVI